MKNYKNPSFALPIASSEAGGQVFAFGGDYKMAKIIYYKGQMFGNIEFLEETKTVTKERKSGRDEHIRYALFKCFCGKIFERVIISVKRRIRTNRIVSCGCGMGVLGKKHGYSSRGGGKRLEYRIWCAMKARCSNHNNDRYHRYGGRGIKVCERWNVFENFIADMKDAPSEKHSIDRINNDGNYEPSNCRWATIYEQSNNKISNVFIEYNGERLTTAQWARKIGIPQHRIASRVRKGYSPKEILSLSLLPNPRSKK